MLDALSLAGLLLFSFLFYAIFYAQDEVGINLPDNYYNLETCYDKMNNMRKEVKKVCEDLKDTRPHASGRAYTPEVCFYSLYALLGGSV